MTNNFKRVILVPDLIDIKQLNHETTKINTLRSMYEITRSKLTTPTILDDKPNFTVIDSEPGKDDKNFAVALIALHPIQVIFDKDDSVGNLKDNPCFDLNQGDLLIFVNLEYKTVLSKHGGTAHFGYHFRTVRYRLKEKTINGNGKNKYKASIVLSDKYEIDVFADSETEAHAIATRTSLYDWDHVYDIDKKRLDNYMVHHSRHSVWLPANITIKREDG